MQYFSLMPWRMQLKLRCRFVLMCTLSNRLPMYCEAENLACRQHEKRECLMQKVSTHPSMSHGVFMQVLPDRRIFAAVNNQC
jgi:hypothetical protein